MHAGSCRAQRESAEFAIHFQREATMKWEKWKDRQAGTELLTFTVITTNPHEVVRPLHDRMPVIIVLEPHIFFTAIRKNQTETIEPQPICLNHLPDETEAF
jgi:putative SOS response-associated peptidase YedK